MSLLILQLPARDRLIAQDACAPPPAALGSGECDWVQSSDGRSLHADGRCAAALLPRAATVVAVLAETDVAFHRIPCPKAPAARLRAALGGVLEEQLLDDSDGLHLALAPDARPGEAAWVAACDRAWLAAQLQALEQQGVVVDRVTPMAWPDEAAPPRLHVHAPRANALQEHSSAESSLFDDESGLVSFSHAEGCATWPMFGTASRALLPSPLPEQVRCTASAALAGAAERWLGRPVQVQTLSERLLAAAQGGWNLRQFELAPRHRGVALLRDGWRQLLSPAWRAVRWGLAGVVAVQLIGLNAWAWVQRHELQGQREEVLQLLRSTHPQVRAVLDAPVQMRRENEALRSAAGRAGDADLEPLLAAAASAWPENLPVQSLRYEGQQLILAAPGLGAAQAEQLRQRLAPAGWRVEATDGRITLQRTATGITGAPR
jgi:general secretion pathway protein L